MAFQREGVDLPREVERVGGDRGDDELRLPSRPVRLDMDGLVRIQLHGYAPQLPALRLVPEGDPRTGAHPAGTRLFPEGEEEGVPAPAPSSPEKRSNTIPSVSLGRSRWVCAVSAGAA